MPDHEQVYAGETRRYDDMISREDPDGAIPGALEAIVDPAGLDVVDVGAGTGRLARLLAPKAKSVVLVDRSGEMLKTAAAKLHEAGHSNWTIRVADQRYLPLPDLSADLVVSGWSICYVASSHQPDHRSNLAAVMREIGRVLRPGGTAVIFETLGTGFSEPNPPDFLADYFLLLEGEYGFEGRWIRTDYRFASSEEARDLSAFFFGEEMLVALRGADGTDLPECTGVWWRAFP